MHIKTKQIFDFIAKLQPLFLEIKRRMKNLISKTAKYLGKLHVRISIPILMHAHLSSYLI